MGLPIEASEVLPSSKDIEAMKGDIISTAGFHSQPSLSEATS